MARIRGVFRESDLDRDFDQELATHLAMAEEDKMRRGMTRTQARRAARVELGGLTQLREASRSARGLPWLSTGWLDVKLGLRMLRKSLGLTLVGGLAMMVVILVATAIFSALGTISGSTLPLDDGGRVVALETWNVATNRREGTSLPDFERWRDTLRSVEDVGAFRAVTHGLVIADDSTRTGSASGLGEPVSVAEMTASGFELARVPPLMGRPLVEPDEVDGARPVVVIGYTVWQSRFAADPAVVGRSLRLGDTVHTVVGVMPEHFQFPVNHGFWTPLRAGTSDPARQEGPAVIVFARLAPGASVEGAQAELTTIGVTSPARAVETTDRLQPRVVPYASAFTNIEPGVIEMIVILISLLLIPPCANIAILVYARTVTRQEEFAARYALGAGRGRIVGQLFVEVLVLALAAEAVALVLAGLALRQQTFSSAQSPGGTPFWMDFGLSPATVVYATGLALLAAIIAGALPASRATGHLLQSGLRALGSRTRMRLGTTWTALVVVQIAFSVAVLPSAVEMTWGLLRPGLQGPGFAADHFVTARLETDQIGRGVRRRVPTALPGEERQAAIELDGVDGLAPPEGRATFRSTFNQVDDRFFAVFDVPLLVGRRFDIGDFSPEPYAVIVNQTLARDLAVHGNPLGRRVRYLGRRGVDDTARSRQPGPATARPWYEIVGVVADIPANANAGTIYHPMSPGTLHPVSLALRQASAQTDGLSHLREVTAAFGPTLSVDDVRRLDEVYLELRQASDSTALALAVATLCALLLSAVGLYALMSFTVNQRRREIGIRSALGAQPRRLLAGVFRRALGQVGAGAGIGIMAALLVDAYLPLDRLGAWDVPGVVPAAAVFMLVIGLLAAFGPARRGLRIEPTQALRDG